MLIPIDRDHERERWDDDTPVHGPTVDNRKWHPKITLDMVEDFDVSIDDEDDILHLIVVPDGWTGRLTPTTFSPGPPKGAGLTGAEEEEEHGGQGPL